MSESLARGALELLLCPQSQNEDSLKLCSSTLTMGCLSRRSGRHLIPTTFQCRAIYQLQLHQGIVSLVGWIRSHSHTQEERENWSLQAFGERTRCMKSSEDVLLWNHLPKDPEDIHDLAVGQRILVGAYAFLFRRAPCMETPTRVQWSVPYHQPFVFFWPRALPTCPAGSGESRGKRVTLKKLDTVPSSFLAFQA